MPASLFLVFVLAIGPASSGPEDLVRGLGASRYAEREAAEAALEALGRAALPSLRANRRNADPEIRARVAALLEKVEGSLLLQPTPVALDFDEIPVRDVVAAINKRAGLDLVLGTDREGAWTSRKVSLRSASPLPFWSAMDRLCDATGLQYNFGSLANLNAREPGFPLVPGEGRPPGPMSDHGPFRVNLMSLHFQRDLSFVNAGQTQFFPPGQPAVPPLPAVNGDQRPGPAAQEQFYARLQVAAEPSLSISQAGAVKLIAAVDDRGQSLAPPPTGTAMEHMISYYGMTTGPVQFQVGLKRPDRPGKTLRLLRGSIPLTVSTRKADPLVVPLDGATGKTFQNADIRLTVHEARPNPNTSQPSIEISVVNSPDRPVPPPAEAEFLSGRVDVGPLQVELVGPEGKLLTWYVSGSSQFGEESRVTLTVLARPSGVAMMPTALRYYGTTKIKADVPFEFRDVPMP